MFLAFDVILGFGGDTRSQKNGQNSCQQRQNLADYFDLDFRDWSVGTVAIKQINEKCIIASIFIASCAISVSAKTIEGIVTHVSDGDTFWIKEAVDKAPIKVRFQGIDAPEICQTWGREATEALRGKIMYKQVSLNTKAKDDYQRLLARVNMQGQDVGAWLVANGHAWSYHYRRDPGPYAAEQQSAQKLRKGLWSGGITQAMEPREFRKVKGACPH